MSGAPNYITPAGFARLREEHRQLFEVERPAVVETISWAAGNGDRSENGDYIYGRKRLREIDKALNRLSARMKDAMVVDPVAQPDKSRVFFGAIVVYVDEEGRLALVDPGLRLEDLQPHCACCTHTLNGTVFTQPYRRS